jgi:hypothetical protein
MTGDLLLRDRSRDARELSEIGTSSEGDVSRVFRRGMRPRTDNERLMEDAWAVEEGRKRQFGIGYD